jgi:hypothetical protein
MTAKESLKVRRLELENAELRSANEKHFQVYRDQAIELIELRAQLALLREVLNG